MTGVVWLLVMAIIAFGALTIVGAGGAKRGCIFLDEFIKLAPVEPYAAALWAIVDLYTLAFANK